MDHFNTGSQHMLYIVELKQYLIQNITATGLLSNRKQGNYLHQISQNFIHIHYGLQRTHNLQEINANPCT